MYSKLITRPLHIPTNKNVDIGQLEVALKTCARDCPFGTFPYSIKGETSRGALKNYGCGNCIALSLFIKKMLKKKHSIESSLIPATIPESYQKNGFLEISHVALAVPERGGRTYILDPAFYLKQPIVVNDDNFPKETEMSDIYSDETCKIHYEEDHIPKTLRFNKWQSIPKNTHCIKCINESKPEDKWIYFLREIINPDKSITPFFINTRSNPWMTILDDDRKLKYSIRRYPENTLVIKKYGETLFDGPMKKVPTLPDFPRYFIDLFKGKIKKYKTKKTRKRKSKKRKSKKD